MSGGLKMLSGSDMSPSKDNLIISSLEDVHITSDEVNMDISVEITKNGGGADNKEAQHNHQKPNKDKSGVREQSSPHLDDVTVMQQKNLINNGSLRNKEHQQQQQQKKKQQQFNPFLVAQPPSLSMSKGRDEKVQLDRDEHNAVLGHEVIDGNNGTSTEGPMVVEVDPVMDELDRRSCCESERTRLDRIMRKKQDERSSEFSRMQSKFRLEGDNKLILNLGWEELVQALQKRELTASSVLEAYKAKVKIRD
ncbi:unnamed protein product [Orchesella dallaii]|uniref:Uncharacterized protein n=1 Tax=Orchesella dallaii TaxID=48710 RepID=A0ABP1Q8U7_9HEXA